MRSYRKWIFFLGLLLALAFGCEADGGSVGEALTVEMAESLCAKQFECCGAPTEDNMMGYESESHCVAVMSGMIFMELEAGQAAGFANADMDKLTACKNLVVTAANAVACDGTTQGSPVSMSYIDIACENYIIGLLGEGDTCETPPVATGGPKGKGYPGVGSDNYCSGDLVCYRVDDSDTETCAPGGVAGDSCSEFSGPYCAKGLVCGEYPDSPSLLHGFTCMAPLADGETCIWSADCASYHCTGDIQSGDTSGVCALKESTTCDYW